MALARDFNRLAPSLAMFLSFFLLGVFVSALGPAVPSLSRDVGVQEVSFGMVFSLRGLGHLLGSWSSSLSLGYGSAAGSGARKFREGAWYRWAFAGCHSGDAPRSGISLTWDYQTQLACSAEETEAIQQYGVEIHSRELRGQRDAAEAGRARIEARAERKAARAKESHAAPSSQTHLMQQSSSENAARSLDPSLNSRERTYLCPLTWTPDRAEQ
eukprot:jgi/Undpi1/9726/HiC_scaffold_27.g12182.m1